jgi:hypothetical protein
MDNINIPVTIAAAGFLIALTTAFQFTRPSIAQGEPPLLPKGLPIVGHAISFIRDANALHMYARSVKKIYISHAFDSKWSYIR